MDNNNFNPNEQERKNAEAQNNGAENQNGSTFGQQNTSGNTYGNTNFGSNPYANGQQYGQSNYNNYNNYNNYGGYSNQNNNGYTPPNNGYSNPYNGYSNPNNGYSNSYNGYNNPNGGYGQPNDAYNANGYDPLDQIKRQQQQAEVASNAKSSLVFGIIALATAIECCGLALTPLWAILAIVKASKAQQLSFPEPMPKKARFGKIFGIVSLGVSVLMWILLAVYIVVLSTL